MGLARRTRYGNRTMADCWLSTCRSFAAVRPMIRRPTCRRRSATVLPARDRITRPSGSPTGAARLELPRHGGGLPVRLDVAIAVLDFRHGHGAGVLALHVLDPLQFVDGGLRARQDRPAAARRRTRAIIAVSHSVLTSRGTPPV